MRRLFAGLLAALLFAMPAWADAPKASVKVDGTASPGDLVVIDGSESTGDAFRWETLSGKKILPVNGGKQAVFASGTPGKYEFLLIAAGTVDGKGAVDVARVAVTIDGPAPPVPGPVPPDDDKPRPKPPGPVDPTPTPVVAGKLHVSLVVDLNAMTPALADLREGIAIRKDFNSLDAAYRTYPSGSAELTRLRLADKVAGKLPCLVIQDAAGKVLYAEQAPATEAEIVAKVKALRGAK